VQTCCKKSTSSRLTSASVYARKKSYREDHAVTNTARGSHRIHVDIRRLIYRLTQLALHPIRRGYHVTSADRHRSERDSDFRSAICQLSSIAYQDERWPRTSRTSSLPAEKVSRSPQSRSSIARQARDRSSDLDFRSVSGSHERVTPEIPDQRDPSSRFPRTIDRSLGRPVSTLKPGRRGALSSRDWRLLRARCTINYHR